MCVRRALAAFALLLCAGRPSAAATPDQQYALAASHYEHGRWELAIVEFEALLADHQQVAQAGEARFFAAEASIQLGRYAAAAERLDAFLGQHAGHRFASLAKFRRGECDYFRQLQGEARQRFSEFVTAYPRHELLEFALPYLGELCLTAGDLQQSQSYYQQALEKFPAGRMAGQCRFGLAQALESQGESQAAERFYRFLAAERGRLAGDARLRLAALLMEQARHEEAVGFLHEVIGDSEQAAWHGEASYLLLKARHAQRKWTEAAAVFERGYGHPPSGPHLPAALMLAAEARRELGELAAARELYRQTIENHTDPKLRNDSLVELFSMELKANAPAAAEAALAKLTTLAPLDPRLAQLQRMWLADRIGNGEYAGARAFLEGLAPSHAAALEHELSYFAALIALGERDYEAAVARLDEFDPQRLPAAMSASAQVARATALVKLQRYGDALAPLEDYLSGNPTGADAPRCRELLALAFAHENRWAEAADALAAVGRQSPRERYYQLAGQLAALAREAEQHELAAKLYGELAEAGDQAPPALLAQALADQARFERQQSPGAASPALERMIRTFPDSSLTRGLLLEAARAASAGGNAPRALACYHRLLDRYSAESEAAEAMLGAALVYDALGQHQEAASLWTLLLDHAGGAEHHDDALYNLAWSLRELDREEESYGLLDRLTREHTQSRYWVDAMLRLAQHDHARHKNEEARQRVALVLQRDLSPTFAAHARYLEGAIAAEAEDWPLVARAMQHVLAAGDEHGLHGPATYWLAESAYQMHDYESAESKFASLAADEREGDSWNAMVALRHAQCLAHRRQWAEAQEQAQAIATRFPGFPNQYEADYLLGRCLAAQARLEEARQAYRRSLAEPLAAGTETASMASWMIGETYFHGRQYTEALRAYYRTAEFSPHPTWRAAALLQAAKCHEVQGEWDKAAQRYNDLLAISPPTRFHAQAEPRRAAALRHATAPSDSSMHTR